VIAHRDRKIFDTADVLRRGKQSDSDVRPPCSLGKDGANLCLHRAAVLLRLRGELLFHVVVQTANDDGCPRRPPPLISIMIAACAATLPEARAVQYDTAPVPSLRGHRDDASTNARCR